MSFFRRGIAKRTIVSRLVRDLTSFSTYGKEFANGESSPRIDMGLRILEETGLTVFCAPRQGSITDKSRLPYVGNN